MSINLRGSQFSLKLIGWCAMQVKARFIEKTSKLIFLEFKKESIFALFEVVAKENIYLPLRPIRVADKVKEGYKFESIPVSFFIEGMFYVLGGDENFKFNSIYLSMLKTKKNEAIEYIKGIIVDEVKKENYEEAYIMLKGLLKIEASEENYDKLFLLLDKLRSSDSAYDEEAIQMLIKSEEIEGYYKPYLDKAIIYYNQKKYDDAWFNISTYIEKSSDTSNDVIELRDSLRNIRHYEKGKSLVLDNPREALEFLLPLLDEFDDDAVLYFNIAVAYRKLGSYHEAIYYLNEAMAIDSAIVEVFNEMGISYAAINDFETAIKYLRKAFEATKSIEICTNLIMCYLNIDDKENAKLHYDIAVKLNPEDEIVLKLKSMFN